MHVLYSTSVAFAVLLATAGMSLAKEVLPGVTASDGAIHIDCAMLNRAATPHFIARADREAAALSKSSPLVAVHGLLKMSLAACNMGGK